MTRNAFLPRKSNRTRAREREKESAISYLDDGSTCTTATAAGRVLFVISELKYSLNQIETESESIAFPFVPSGQQGAGRI